MRMLDLFSGFGGQSEAFLRAGWEVMRVDNNPLLSGVENMVEIDVKHIPPAPVDPGRIEYVHASPPCLDFSTAYSSPRSLAERGEEEEYRPDLSLLFEAMRIIDEVQPRYWSIENVRGSIRYFKPYLGEPTLIIGAFVYWGNFPQFSTENIVVKRKQDKDKRHSPLRANHRAHIDLSISQAFLKAMVAQKSILDY